MKEEIVNERQCETEDEKIKRKSHERRKSKREGTPNG